MDQIKKLTISQALRRRKQLKGSIAVFTSRLDEALTYDGKSPPTFSFEDSNRGLLDSRSELIALEDAVARANANTTIMFQNSPVALTWVLRVLSEVKGEIRRFEQYEHRALLNEREVREEIDEPIPGQVITTTLLDGSTNRSFVTRKVTKVKFSSITERERADKVESLKREFDSLNDLLETANHTTVIEYHVQSGEDKVSGAAPQTP